MSVVPDYHFDSLKKFASTLKNSDWSEVDKPMADYYMHQLKKKYDKVVLDPHFGSNESSLEEAKQIYRSCHDVIESHIAKLGANITPQIYFGVENCAETESMQLPQDVSEFSGSFIEWCDFMERFNTIVHLDTRLTKTDKLCRLLELVTGNAARELSNWVVDDNHYLPAINKLRSVYGNKYLIARAHVEAIESRPPIETTHESVTALMKEIAKAEKDLARMRLPSERWELLVIAAAEKRMDEQSRLNWMAIRLGEAVEMPTLAGLQVFLQGRAFTMPSSSNVSRSFWPDSNSTMFSQASTTASTSKPKLETTKARSSARKWPKNGACFICQTEVTKDQIECRDCPALAHYRCLNNSGQVKNKKDARIWKCHKCLRCAKCYSTKKMVSDFTVFLASANSHLSCVLASCSQGALKRCHECNRAYHLKCDPNAAAAGVFKCDSCLHRNPNADTL